MNRPNSAQATGLAGTLVGTAAITGLIAGIELQGEPHAGIWFNMWLVTSVVLALVALAVVTAYLLASMFVQAEGNRKAVAESDSFQEGEADHARAVGLTRSRPHLG